MNINEWLSNDVPLHNINIGDSLLSTLDNLGLENVTLVGDEKNGYYYLSNGYRFGFSNNTIDEIGIDFDSSKTKVVFKTDDIVFNFKNKKIHKVLDFFNDNLLEWRAIESLDTQHLMIRLVKTNIVFIFDVYEGTLSKIVKSNIG